MKILSEHFKLRKNQFVGKTCIFNKKSQISGIFVNLISFGFSLKFKDKPVYASRKNNFHKIL